jgi:hypothetical protein
MGTMLRRDYEALERLSRDRERIAKHAADARASELDADFEQQMAKTYSFDQDAIWREANRLADEETRQANSVIANRCKELGIPKEFAPSLHLYWTSRGENAIASRRAELRRVAKTRIDALTKNAKTKIAVEASTFRTRLLEGALESEEAKQLLKSMPTATDLMPKFELREIEKAVPVRGMLQ